jgi:hypothetical protein
MPFRHPRYSVSPKDECGSVVPTTGSSASIKPKSLPRAAHALRAALTTNRFRRINTRLGLFVTAAQCLSNGWRSGIRLAISAVEGLHLRTNLFDALPAEALGHSASLAVCFSKRDLGDLARVPQSAPEQHQDWRILPAEVEFSEFSSCNNQRRAQLCIGRLQFGDALHLIGHAYDVPGCPPDSLRRST